MPQLLQLSSLASAASLIQLAATLAEHEPSSWPVLSGGYTQVQLRQGVKHLLEAFFACQGEPEALIAALQAAAGMKYALQAEVEVVWTGPANPEHLRMTHAAVLEVLEAASHELWLVSYVFKEVMTLAAPLRKALGRGVRLRVVTEERKQQLALDAFELMGPDILAATEFLIWQSDQRRHYSSLHAKCLLADQGKVLITSANFTSAAQNENIEMGVLMTGGAEPARVSRLLHHLLHQGILKPLPSKEVGHDEIGVN